MALDPEPFQHTCNGSDLDFRDGKARLLKENTSSFLNLICEAILFSFFSMFLLEASRGWAPIDLSSAQRRKRRS